MSALPRAGARTAGHVLGSVGGLSHIGSRLRVADHGDAGGHADGSGQSQTILQSDREATVRLSNAQLQHGTSHKQASITDILGELTHSFSSTESVFGIISPDQILRGVNTLIIIITFIIIT